MAEAKIVVTSDVHLDGGLDDRRLNPETGRPRAWESTGRIWDDICTWAIENTADAVVVPGDLWRNGWPKAEAVLMIKDGLLRLQQAGIPVVLGKGNHELIMLGHRHRSPIEHFADLDNVTVVSRVPEVVTLPSGAQVVCFPWPTRTVLLERWEWEGMTAEEADDLTAARMTQLIEEAAEKVDVGRGPVILAGHATVSNATLSSDRRGSERSLAAVVHEPVIPVSALDVAPWQAIALGHVHRAQTLGERAFFYAGSPNRIDRSEEHDEKSFVVLHVPDDGSVARVERIPTAARRFVTVTIPEGVGAEDLEKFLPRDPEGTITYFELPAGGGVALETEVRRLAERNGMSAEIRSRPALRSSTEQERASVPEDVDPVKGLELWLDTQPQITAAVRAGVVAKAGELLGTQV